MLQTSRLLLYAPRARVPLPLVFRKSYFEPQRVNSVASTDTMTPPRTAQPASRPFPPTLEMPSALPAANSETAVNDDITFLTRLLAEVQGKTQEDILRGNSATSSVLQTTAANDRAAAFQQFQRQFPTDSSRGNRADLPAPQNVFAVTAAEQEEFRLFMEMTDDEASDEVCDAAAAYLDKLMRGASASAAALTPADSKTDRLAAVQPLTDKEHKFHRTLKDVQRAFDGANIPWFITCGTALGARREGRFIAHDDDIDIGIFFADLCKRPAAAASARPVRNDGEDEAELLSAQGTAMDLLSSIGTSSRLDCFDVLGAVERGFQMRFRHADTGVLVDVNCYYTAIDESTGEPYVWTATHYAESQSRRFGMYRYRNRYPLKLTPVDFYDLQGLRCPTEEYLVEYFGADWRTPKKYNYEQGLAGEYRNIIPE
jgi:hypothetical protein